MEGKKVFKPCVWVKSGGTLQVPLSHFIIRGELVDLGGMQLVKAGESYTQMSAADNTWFDTYEEARARMVAEMRKYSARIEEMATEAEKLTEVI